MIHFLARIRAYIIVKQITHSRRLAFWVALSSLVLFFPPWVLSQTQHDRILLNQNANIRQAYTTGGTVTQGHLLKLNTSAQVIETVTSDLSGVIGVADASASSGATINVVLLGQSQTVTVDGACTASNLLVISSTIAGNAHCVVSPTAGQQVLGVSLATVTVAGNVLTSIQPGLIPSSTSGGGTVAPNTGSFIVEMLVPSGLGGSLAAGGTLTINTAFFWIVTALDDKSVETTRSNEVTLTATVSGTQTASLTWTATTGAQSYKIYRGTVAGSENVFFTSTTNSFSDTGGAGTVGTPPTFNAARISGMDSTSLYSGGNIKLLGTATAPATISYAGTVASAFSFPANGTLGGNILTQLATQSGITSKQFTSAKFDTSMIFVPATGSNTTLLWTGQSSPFNLSIPTLQANDSFACLACTQTFTGGTTLSGVTISGTIPGNPTWSGTHIFNNSPSMPGFILTGTGTGPLISGIGANQFLTLLNYQSSAAAIVGTGADVNVYSFSIPANTIATLRGIRIRVGASHTTGTASVSYKWTFGATTCSTQSSTAVEVSSEVLIFNKTAQTTQDCYVVGSRFDATSGAPAFAAAAENTATAVTVKFTFNVAATDQVTPRIWIVELVQ